MHAPPKHPRPGPQRGLSLGSLGSRRATDGAAPPPPPTTTTTTRYSPTSPLPTSPLPTAASHAKKQRIADWQQGQLERAAGETNVNFQPVGDWRDRVAKARQKKPQA